MDSISTYQSVNIIPPSPYVSIIIPIRNEEKYIRASLEAVLSQDYPSDKMEVIVADGLSNDHTREIITELQLKGAPILLIDNPGKIVPTGMNSALPLTSGHIIIRVDGHCIISHDYVRKCVEHISNEGVDGVGGPMYTIGETLFSEVIAIAMSTPFGVGGSAFRTMVGKTVLADTVPFPAYTREIIKKIGLYDEELVRNQDDEYNYRLREAGGKLLLAADVLSKYYSRGSYGKLWKQYYQYGFWKVRVLQKHPRQMSLRQFIPPTFVLAIIASLVLAMLLPWGWVSIAFIWSSYFIANITAAILTASRKGWQYLPLLSLTFLILHLSYGFGFWMGIIKFWNRWGDKVGRVPDINSSGY